MRSTATDEDFARWVLPADRQVLVLDEWLAEPDGETRSKEEQTGVSRGKPGTDWVVGLAKGRTTTAGGAGKGCSPC